MPTRRGGRLGRPAGPGSAYRPLASAPPRSTATRQTLPENRDGQEKERAGSCLFILPSVFFLCPLCLCGSVFPAAKCLSQKVCGGTFSTCRASHFSEFRHVGNVPPQAFWDSH